MKVFESGPSYYNIVVTLPVSSYFCLCTQTVVYNVNGVHLQEYLTACPGELPEYYVIYFESGQGDCPPFKSEDLKATQRGLISRLAFWEQIVSQEKRIVNAGLNGNP